MSLQQHNRKVMLDYVLQITMNQQERSIKTIQDAMKNGWSIDLGNAQIAAIKNL